jgi:hypothetical protein
MQKNKPLLYGVIAAQSVQIAQNSTEDRRKNYQTGILPKQSWMVVEASAPHATYCRVDFLPSSTTLKVENDLYPAEPCPIMVIPTITCL